MPCDPSAQPITRTQIRSCAQRLQRLVGEEPVDREVGDEQARRPSPGAVASRWAISRPSGRGEVEGDRLLALVQPLPVEARPVVGERPAAEVRPAADVVEADHLGAHLRQIEPAGRRGHERRALHHAQAFQEVVHRIRLVRPISVRRPLSTSSGRQRPGGRGGVGLAPARAWSRRRSPRTPPRGPAARRRPVPGWCGRARRAQASSFSTLSKFLSLMAAAPRAPQAARRVPSGGFSPRLYLPLSRPERQREERQEAQAEVLAGRQHLELHLPLQQGIVVLGRDEPGRRRPPSSPRRRSASR